MRHPHPGLKFSFIAVLGVAFVAAPVHAQPPATQPSSDAATALEVLALTRQLNDRAAVNQHWVSFLNGKQTANSHQALANWLQAHQFHANAIASLGQCQSCHTVPALNHALVQAGTRPGWVNVANDQPYVGVTAGPADDVLRSQLRLPEGTGVVVTAVAPESPAAAAGVEAGDVLLSLGGEPVSSGDDLDRIVRAAKADGTAFAAELLHEGQRVKRDIAPRKMTPDAAEYLIQVLAAPVPEFRIGVATAAPDDTLRKHLKLGDGGGLVVTMVEEDSPAEKQGVKVNDVVLTANGRALRELNDLREVVQQSEGNAVQIELLRGGVPLRVSPTPVKVEVRDTTLDWATAATLTRQLDAELLLLQPRPANNAANYYDLVYRSAALTTQPAAAAATTAQRLEQISAQLDALRAAVEELRATMAKPPAPDQPK